MKVNFNFLRYKEHYKDLLGPMSGERIYSQGTPYIIKFLDPPLDHLRNPRVVRFSSLTIG